MRVSKTDQAIARFESQIAVLPQCIAALRALPHEQKITPARKPRKKEPEATT